jgi:hypothetical protein
VISHPVVRDGVAWELECAEELVRLQRRRSGSESPLGLQINTAVQIAHGVMDAWKESGHGPW